MATDSAIPTHLGCALLGLVARFPSTGYRLAQRMQEPVGYFWTARHSQIYPELARLESGGLVDHVVIEGAGPRPTKEYRITEAGRRALAEWISSELEPQPVRDLETLRLWSVWLVAPEMGAQLVAQVRARHASRLAALEAELAELLDAPEAYDRGHPWFASRLTLHGGVLAARAAVEWADWMAAELAG